MKNNIKKLGAGILVVLAVVSLVMTGFCAADETGEFSLEKQVATMDSIPVSVIADYRDLGMSGVIQLADITSIDDDNVIPLINALLDWHTIDTQNMNEAVPDACSCIYVPQGTSTLMGRNLDLMVSNYPAWVFYVDAPGKYRSFNMGYLENLMKYLDLPTLDELEDNPIISSLTATLIPYVVTDAINEKGLIIEVNVHNQPDQLVTTGTNPSSDIRIYNGILLRYLIDRCATIDDVLETVKGLNIYSTSNNLLSIQFALSMMDATGRCGVMEFAGNTIEWHDSSDTDFWNGRNPGHTNFWITPDAYNISNCVSGKSRFSTLQNETKLPVSKEKMWNALSQVYREQFFTKHAEDVTYDVVYDCNKNFNNILNNALELKRQGKIILDDDKVRQVQDILDKHQEYKDKAWDAKFLTNATNRNDILTCYNFTVDVYTQLSKDEIRDNKLIEYSIFTYVLESGSTTMQVKFFEQPEIYTFELPNKYKVSVVTEGSGIAYSSVASGITGTKVFLTAEPNIGYVFKRWEVLEGDVEIKKDNTFIIGKSDVTVKAVFTREKSNSSHQGATRILPATAEPTVVATQAPVDVPTIATLKPTTKPTQKSPAPLAGLLAGFGVIALLRGLRK